MLNGLVSQSPISGQVRRTTPAVRTFRTRESCHKALSAGRCDGHDEQWDDSIREAVTKPYQRAGATDVFEHGASQMLGESQSPISGQVRRTGGR